MNQEAPDILGNAIEGLSLKDMMGKKNKKKGSSLSDLSFPDGDFNSFYKMIQADRMFNQPTQYNLGVLPQGQNIFMNSGGL